MRPRLRNLLILTALISTASTTLLVPPAYAATYIQRSLSATVSATTVSAFTSVATSASLRVDEYGICVRDQQHRVRDFSPKQQAVELSPSGLEYHASGTYDPGTYTYFPCAKTSGAWHVIGAEKSFTVASAVPSSATVSRSAAGWSGDLSKVPQGSMGCHRDDNTATNSELRKIWDHWDNCGGRVVDPTQVGIPRPPGGSRRVVRWSKAAGSDQVYQKLNRTFTKDNWPHGSQSKVIPARSPADVSAVYMAYLYVPSSDFHLSSSHGWAQLLQLKETFLDAGGGWHQAPIWAAGVNNFGGQTVGGGLWPDNTHTFALSDYQDRWVRWELRLYQGAKDSSGHGGRVELWADGKLLQTGYESRRHVGSGAYVPLRQTLGFVWIAGPYTSNQSTDGVPDYVRTHVTMFVGPSSVIPL